MTDVRNLFYVMVAVFKCQLKSSSFLSSVMLVLQGTSRLQSIFFYCYLILKMVYPVDSQLNSTNVDIITINQSDSGDLCFFLMNIKAP